MAGRRIFDIYPFDWRLMSLVTSFLHRFFLEQMYLEHDGWNLIFYTGKTPLSSAIESARTNIRVISRR
jgi:hypothetical protein